MVKGAGQRFNGLGVIVCDDCYGVVKHCKRCNTIKDRGAFNKSRDKLTGLKAHCKQCESDAWYESPPEKRTLAKRAKFNLTHDEYLRMRASHDDLCAICGSPETEVIKGGVLRTLAIDHCHTSGAIRGLLCGRCNKAIGLFYDSPELLRAAIEYLEKYAAAA